MKTLSAAWRPFANTSTRYLSAKMRSSRSSAAGRSATAKGASVSPTQSVPVSGRSRIRSPSSRSSANSRTPNRFRSACARSTVMRNSNASPSRSAMRVLAWSGASRPGGVRVTSRIVTGSRRSDRSSMSGSMRRLPSSCRLSSRGRDCTVRRLIAGSAVASHAHITRLPSGVSTLSGAKKSRYTGSASDWPARRQFMRPCRSGTNCSASASQSPR